MTALPTRKLEAWRYTDLRPLASIEFAAPPPVVAPALPNIDLPRLVFLNGSLAAEFSSPFEYVQNFQAVAEDSTQPLAIINAEKANDGVTLHVPAGVDAGTLLLISCAAGSEPFAFHLRHRITLGEGAKLTLIEIARGEGVYWHDPVTDITLGQGAKLAHIRLQDESREAFHLATIRARVAEAAAYDHFTATIGAKLSRTEISAALTGTGALAHLNGAQLLTGTQHGDFTTVVAHKAPGCPSRQTVKSVLAGTARGVFQGRIEVDRVAQQSDGFQLCQALLLSPGAEMDIKPELEIFADDVKCSHGATIGALDAEQLFYLRSRGIPDDQARSMLIRAFLEEALEPVTQPQARALLEEAIDNWWVKQ